MDASDLLRGALLQLSDSDLIRSAVLKAPVSRSVVSRRWMRANCTPVLGVSPGLMPVQIEKQRIHSASIRRHGVSTRIGLAELCSQSKAGRRTAGLVNHS